MSIFSSILRTAYKLSGAKKAFGLPENEIKKVVEKQNRHRGVFTPTDRKAYYETIAVNGFPCLIVREHPKPSERAILYFFGGGMVIGPDKGDLPVMRKLCREAGCDVWFPFYPLCMEHCITETYAMVYECYRKMIGLYGDGNVSTCGFSSGGALALGIAAHNNVQPEPLPQPRHIVAVSPGEVPWNDGEKSRMKALNERDVSIDYLFPFYMIGYGVIRCFVEGLRTDSLYLMPGVRVSQVLSGCLILLGVLLVGIIRRRQDIQA